VQAVQKSRRHYLMDEVSALRAAKWGGVACLLQAGRLMIGNVLTATSSGKAIDSAIAWFVGASIIPVGIAIAGVLLWRERSWKSGCFVVVVMLADLLLYGTGDVLGLVVRLALLLVIANGLRGAWNLRLAGEATEQADQAAT
jgi:hypothetical protein